MKIRITDIPPEGRDLSFEMDRDAINGRLRESEDDQGRSVASPHYHFTSTPTAEVHLELEGRTVLIRGAAHADYQTKCSRCAEDTVQHLDVPIRVVLKPTSERSRPGEEVEDVELGFYDGKEVDCADISEEFLVLNVPFKVLCQPDCKGLCPTCGFNLNAGLCECPAETPTDDRFSVLRQLKIQ